MTNGPFDLSKTPLHVGSIAGLESPAIALTDFGFDGPSFEAYIETLCLSGPGRIIMVKTSPANWLIWQRHTKGDEIIVVLDGAGEFIHDIDGEHPSLSVKKGSAII
ncbi:MAG: hypothetical protein ACI8Z1_002397 [Candidatus Azotimanducaceae bacterium]|jgi:hypothetical protein